MSFIKPIFVFLFLCLLLSGNAYAYRYKLEFIHQDAPSERSCFMLFEDGKTISAKIYYKDGWEESLSVKEIEISKGKKYNLSDLFNNDFFENSFNHGGIAWMYIVFDSVYSPVSKKGYSSNYFAGPESVVYKNCNSSSYRKSPAYLKK